jgi:two-component system chemotaxis response regulator CheY
MNMKSVMVVEDSELLHRMYDLILMRYKAQGTSIHHAFNGQQALEMLAARPQVDLILLDINMPVMSGLEFLLHCKKQRVFQEIPVIIISTEGKEQDTIRGLEAGARGYLTKPFQPNDLHALIGRVMGWSSAPVSSKTGVAVVAGDPPRRPGSPG